MGAFAKAYQRTGKDALGQVVDFFEGLRKQREQEEVYNQIIGAVQNYQNNFQQGQDKLTLDSLEGNVTNPFQPTAQRGSLGAYGPTEQPVKRVNPLGMTMDDIPTSPEAQTKPVSQKQRYEQGQNSLNEFINNIIPMIANPNVGNDQLGRLDTIGRLLGGQVEQMRPPEAKQNELKSIETDRGIYAFNPLSGESTLSAEFPQEAKSSVFGNPTNMGYWTDQDGDGQPEFVQNPYYKDLTGKTGKGSGSGEGENVIPNYGEKGFPNSVADDIASLKEGENVFKEFYGQKPIPYTELSEQDQLDLGDINELPPEETNFYRVGKKLVSIPEFTKNKSKYLAETLKPYREKANKVIKEYEAKTGVPLEDVKGIIQQDMKTNGVTKEQALQRFYQANPQLPKAAMEILKYYFLYNG